MAPLGGKRRRAEALKEGDFVDKRKEGAYTVL